ncbi:hypothetical protein EV1_038333 [Malus domestica]
MLGEISQWLRLVGYVANTNPAPFAIEDQLGLDAVLGSWSMVPFTMTDLVQVMYNDIYLCHFLMEKWCNKLISSTTTRL